MKIQQAICICTDLWEVQTIEVHNTLVWAKTAKQAKKKTLRFLQGSWESFTWAQHTRIKEDVNILFRLEGVGNERRMGNDETRTLSNK